jgi:hypothetical protein
MKMLGANPAVKVTALDELPGTVNYFIGNYPAKWRTNIPTYAQVRYAGIYRGIDLVYHGNPSADGQLEFDFTVAPHADPGGIRLRFGGPNELHLAANGDLVVTTGSGALAFHKPVAYQILNGDRKPIAGDFVLLARHTVGFRLGGHECTQALVIDPALAYSTFLGGSGADAANAITVDTAGNAYVTGRASSTDFPVTPGAYQTTNHAAPYRTNAFVTKLNPTGTALVYSTYLGGSGGDIGSAIAVDAAGNAYVTGGTSSTDFPVTPGAFQTTNKAAANGDFNAFITKLNPTGTALVYSTYLGGSGLPTDTPDSGDQGNAIAADAGGNAYVTGATFSTDFPVTPGAFQTTNSGESAFVTKLNPTGTALVYSTYLGPVGNNQGRGQPSFLAVDGPGNAYVTGATSASDFPVTAGAYQTTNHAAAEGFNNVFVTKLNPAGTALVYSTYLGGSGGSCCAGDLASGVAVDSSGKVYVTGTTQSTDFPVTPGAFQTMNHGEAHNLPNAFITELNPAGTALVYSTYLGGSGGVINLSATLAELAGDQASGLAIDSSDNAYVTGSTASSDFPVTAGAYQTTNHDQCSSGCIGGYNAFITELNSTGSALVYSTYLGGNGINPNDFVGVAVFGQGDQANALAVDSSGNVYVTGSAQSYDFPVTPGAFQTTVNSRGGNPFVAKLTMGATSTAITPTVTVTPASSTITSGRPLAVAVSVNGGSGNPVPTGTVTLASGTYASEATTLSAGSATIDVPAGSLLATPVGYLSADLLLANYVPDAASSATYNFSSGIGSVTVVAPVVSVTPSSTTLTWSQSQSQALPVAMAATGGTGNPTPTGTVTLTTGSYSSGATALSNGSATISIPAGTLTTGFNILYVSYSGDSNYAAVAVAGSALVTVGTAGTPGFTIAGTAVLVAPGATTGNVSTVTITPTGGFTGTVTLAAAIASSPSGAKYPPTLSFGGNGPVSISGTAAVPVPLTISTTAATSCGQSYPAPRGLPWYTGLGAALACLCLLGIRARRRRWRTAFAVLALVLALAGGWLACGGSPPCVATAGTTPGIYTITVTGASASTTATGTVTLTVQ